MKMNTGRISLIYMTMLKVILLSLGIGRNGWQVSQIVVFVSVRDGFQVFRISAVGDADTGDLSMLCHVYCLLFFYNGIVGKLIPGDSAALFHKTDAPLCVGICLGDLNSWYLEPKGKLKTISCDFCIFWRCLIQCLILSVTICFT